MYKDLDDHITGMCLPYVLPNLTLKDAKSIAKSHGLHVQWKAKPMILLPSCWTFVWFLRYSYFRICTSCSEIWFCKKQEVV